MCDAVLYYEILHLEYKKILSAVDLMASFNVNTLYTHTCPFCQMRLENILVIEKKMLKDFTFFFLQISITLL